MTFGRMRAGLTAPRPLTMSEPERSQAQDLLRRSAAGDERSRREFTGVIKRRLSSEPEPLQPGPGIATPPHPTCLDLVAATGELTRDVLGEPTTPEREVELLCAVARAFEELLGTAGPRGGPVAPTVLLAPLHPGAERVPVSTPELGDALKRMEQLRGTGALLTILCLVLDLSVDEAAQATRIPSDLAELEWTVAKEWLERELDLSGRT